MRLVARLLIAGLVMSIGIGTASAGLFRTYLSFNGNDANPCTVGAPCRLLPAALAAVNNGGEIWMVDSANYNTAPVTISKSVKILAIPGALGSLVANGGDAVIINAPGGTVTLKNLSVLNFNAGINGITIQDANAVHIEKVSIDGFNTDTSACIQLSSASTVLIWVVDSFIRECHRGIFANTPALSDSSVIVIDNTRIERGVDQGAVTGAGVWTHGADLTLRNSMISLQDVALQFDGVNNVLAIVNSEIAGFGTGLLYNNVSVNGTGDIAITGSQFYGGDHAITISNSAAGGVVTASITDSSISFANNSGLQLRNTAADNNSRLFLNMVHSQIIEVANVAVDLLASNGSRIQVVARDSTLANSTTLLKTAGGGAGGDLHVDLVRSTMNNSTTAIDHGYGRIRLDGTHVTYNANAFVNNGSGNIVSIGNNFVTDNVNGSGFTYITPTIIAPQ